MKSFITELEQHQTVMTALLSCHDAIHAAAELLIKTLQQGNKLLLCGNGGSAADCQHLAAEFVVRYVRHRQALAAIALTTDSSILTAHSNDFGFESVFARQVDALGNTGDCLIAISTSGNSVNIVQAVHAARNKGLVVVVLTGGTGGQLLHLANVAIVVPSTITARIQEAHILIGHWWCGVAEEKLCVSDNA